ncbi:MAG: dTDP-4-dehydrorhamnose reductase [Acidimicrobiales bacterium]|jgi:dTDP-4-dehydrorhamnose reductase
MTRRRVLVTGASGQLGHDLVAALSGEVPDGGLYADPRTGRLGDRPVADVVAAPRDVLDVSKREEVLEAVSALRPEVVIHAGAFTNVDGCELDPERAFAVNAFGTRNLAEACNRYHSHLIVMSTDYVFDGTGTRPYVEWDATNPLSAYGRSKLGGEKEAGPDATIIRTSWVSGAHGKNMVRTVLELAKGEGTLRFVDDQRGRPTFTADLAGAVLMVADSRLPGIFHLTNDGEATWYELVRTVLAISGGDPGRVEPISTAELDPPRPAPRPAYSVLENAAARMAGLPALPHWEDALGRLVKAVQAQGGGSSAK